MKKVIRKKCIFCKSDDLEHLYCFRDFPVNQNMTIERQEYDLLMDLQYGICKNCGMIQVESIPSEEELYNGEHSRGIGRTWQNHYREFSHFIRKFKPERIFEIGGGAGYIEVYFHEEKDDPLEWVILEPNPQPVKECRAVYINGFFDKDYVLDKKFDTIIFSHLLEHIYEPDAFLKHISKDMPIGTKLIFSVPNMQKMLENKQTNTLNFEHSFFLTETYINFLLAKNGFAVVKKEEYLEHSLFYAAVLTGKNIEARLGVGLYERNKKIFSGFIDDYKEFAVLVDSFMRDNPDMPIYMFGAHLFSQFLIWFGIDENRVKAILDNDVAKQGKRLQGTNLICMSPGVLAAEEKAALILRAGTYQDEIKEDLLKNINPHIVILE